jgi:hypothetical protein
MKFRIEVICVSEDGAEERSEVTAIERQELAMETLGLNLADGKSILERLQHFVVAQQTAEDLEQRRACPRCLGSLRRKRKERSPWGSTGESLFSRNDP